MANYTTEVRTICEDYAGLKTSVGYKSVADVIAKAQPKVFDFEYPLYDPNYKNVLERKILRHYYTREIGMETVGLWKLRLEAKLNEIMPYYNKLYELETLQFNPLYDVDLTRSHVRDTKETGENTGSTDSSENRETSGGNEQERERNDVNTESRAEQSTKTEDGSTNRERDTSGQNELNGQTDTQTGSTETRDLKTEGKNAEYSKGTESVSRDSTADHTGTNTIKSDGTVTTDANNTSITDTTGKRTTTTSGSDTLTDSGTVTTKGTDGWTETEDRNLKTQVDGDTQGRNALNDTPQANFGAIQDGYLTSYTDASGTSHTTTEETGTIDRERKGNANSTATTELSHETEYGKKTIEDSTGNSKTTDSGHGTETTDGKSTETRALKDTETVQTEGETTKNTTGSTTSAETGDITREGTESASRSETQSSTGKEVETGSAKTTTDGHSTGSTEQLRDSTEHLTTNTRESAQETAKSNTRTEHQINTLEDYIETVKGRSGGRSAASLWLEYRNTLMNIDLMIIEDLSDLFMNLW